MNTQNPQIALLGLGSRSSLFYLETLNKKYHEQHGNYHTFPCLLYNVDFNTINPFLPNNFEVLIPQLIHYLNQVFKLPIKSCIIPNITLHETFDRACLKHHIVHPVHLSIDFLKSNEVKNVTIFGSKYTMETDYLSTLLKAVNIAIYIPKTEDIETLDGLRQKIYNHAETPKDIETYKNLINHYSIDSHVLVACTELSILHKETQPNNHVIDMAWLQIEKVLTLSV